MASRSEAHEIFPLLFAKDGVLQACICNNAKEMIQGRLYQKLKDYTPWPNTAEREIKELKKGVGCKLLMSRAPKHLWDDFERLYQVQYIYKLDREVPKTVMLGEASNIRQFCELEWFEWFIF